MGARSLRPGAAAPFAAAGCAALLAGGCAGAATCAAGATGRLGADGAVAGAAAGLAAAGTAALGWLPAPADAPSAARTVTMRSPVLTLPPLLACRFSTTPTAVDGTSMV